MAKQNKNKEGWRTINDPPSENGYVLLAITHHNIPMVVMGHCMIIGGHPRYKEEVYHGNSVIITHWMELPKHPFEKD